MELRMPELRELSDSETTSVVGGEMQEIHMGGVTIQWDNSSGYFGVCSGNTCVTMGPTSMSQHTRIY